MRAGLIRQSVQQAPDDITNMFVFLGCIIYEAEGETLK